MTAWPRKRRNMVGAVCTCGKFINAKDHEELLDRVNHHHRNCPTYVIDRIDALEREMQQAKEHGP